jgi:lambda family phage portal protein
VRNNGHAESALGTIVDDTIGWGILPSARHEAWQRWTESTDIDADGRCDLAGIEHAVMRAVVESGECLIRRRFRRPSDGLALPLQIQVLEPDYLDSGKYMSIPNGGGKIVRGVEFDSIGRRVAYWLYRNHPGSTTLSSATRFGQSVRVPASEILHVYRQQRPGQVRGASWFAPVLIRFNDFDEFADATLMKQKIAACLAIISTDVDGNAPSVGAEDTDNETHDDLGPGMILNLPTGRDVEVVNPPTVRDYSDFSKTTLREIAAGIGVNLEDLTGDYADINFSAARMSRLRHWARIQGWRWRMLVPQFLNPLWAWAMQVSAIAGLGVVDGTGWTAPPLPMIEPDKEGLAITRNIRAGIMTLSEALRERGFVPSEHWDEYQADFEDLDRRGLVTDSDARKMTQQGMAQMQSSSPGAGSSANNIEPGEYLSISDAAGQFELHPETLRQWVRNGTVPHIRIGPSPGTIRLRQCDLMRLCRIDG